MGDLLEMLAAMRPDAPPVPEKETDDTGSEPLGVGTPKVSDISHSYDEIIRHTQKATLFRVGKSCYWLPKSKYWTNSEKPNVVKAPHWLEVTLKPLTDKERHEK